MEAAQHSESERNNIWIRGLVMLFFIIAFGLAQTIQNITAVIQFVWLLVNKEPNGFLSRFGSSLSKWFAEVSRFLTCAGEERPFPWRAWPEAD